MKFDWYEATLAAGADEVVGELLRQGDGLAIVRPHKGTTYGYERSYEVALGQRVLATVYYGGTAQGSGVHVSATGAEALWFSKLCREKFADHVVTRLDVAEDYHGEGAFEQLSGLCIDVARGRGLRTFNVGDWAQGIDGRTLYVGSFKSTARVRCYEKGKEYRDRGVMVGKAPPIDWTRVEGVFRPKRLARRVLAHAPPGECFAMALWTRELYNRLTGIELAKLEDVSWVPSDDERAYGWMLRQYGPLLGRICERLGSWPAVGAQVGEDIVKGDAQ